jgi:hypothetical protein
MEPLDWFSGVCAVMEIVPKKQHTRSVYKALDHDFVMFDGFSL